MSNSSQSFVDPDFEQSEKAIFLIFKIKNIIEGKDSMGDIALSVRHYLKENIPNHRFLVYADKGTNSDFVCNFSAVRIYKSDGLFIYLKKLKRQENIKSNFDTIDFNSSVEYFSRCLSEQSLSISVQAKNLFDKIVSKFGKNVIAWVVKEEVGAWGFSSYFNTNFYHHISFNNYQYGACYYDN
jgi:hypothetical protein